MKKYILYFISLLALSSTFMSCDDFMKVDSSTTVNDITAKSDTVYPLFGILAKFQKLADDYVVLGELRGELLTTTVNADPDLREIENYDVRSDNPYADVRPYYAVINNCNQILADTALRDSTKFRYEYASIALIRAWTYLQLGINYNKAVYLQQPLLNIADLSLTANSQISFDQLIDQLIVDVKMVSASYTLIPTYSVPYTCPQSKFVLGELYMWKATLAQEKEIANNTVDSLKTSTANYVIAAGYYKSIIQNDGSLSANTDMYKLSSLFGGDSWGNIFSYSRATTNLVNEVMWMNTISLNSKYAYSNNLNSLFYTSYKLKPTDYIMNQWSIQKTTTGTIGDKRGLNSSWSMVNGVPIVQKYRSNSEVYLARAGMIHLRYAEAINRCGKPMLAITALKYGLSKANIALYVPLKEVPLSPTTYINFTDTRYDLSKGVRGRVLLDPTTIVVPNFKWDVNDPTKSKSDSINFVEETILQEYALETAFEGNRWADCMRIALRRADSGEYMYNLMKQKLVSDAVASKLKDKQYWYLPFPE